MSHDIYVSYAREDLSRVDPLVKAIELEGYSVWRDQTALRPGVTWQDMIEQAIAAAKCVLVVWSDAAQTSEWVQTEAAKARDAHKLVSVRLSEFVGNFLGIDLSDWDGGPAHPSFQRLVRAITPLAGPPPSPHAPPRPTRRLRVPDIAWVEIPGGPFVYQEGDTRQLPTFRIARYPITNAQYQTFIDDGGYQDSRWWRGLKRPEPGSPRWPQPNRPRTNVDWYEAVAFTRWLNARLGLAEVSIRLPTELQWEKAARGENGLVFPWGSEYRAGFGNTNETNAEAGPWYLEQTSAVGLYPHGRSPYGVEDLAGNVWEWCLNKYKDSDDIRVDSSTDSRAARGGSWRDYPTNARADTRNGYRPQLRLLSRGLRVVSSVPIRLP